MLQEVLPLLTSLQLFGAHFLGAFNDLRQAHVAWVGLFRDPLARVVDLAVAVAGVLDTSPPAFRAQLLAQLSRDCPLLVSPLGEGDLQQVEALLEHLGCGNIAMEAPAAAAGGVPPGQPPHREVVWFVRPGLVRYHLAEDAPPEVYHPERDSVTQSVTTSVSQCVT